jgi:MFS family permease
MKDAVRGTFRSLHTRNFRLFWSGQLLSLVGSWMQTTALVVLVTYKLHANGTSLGFVVASQFLPTLLAGPWGGLAADRFDKRRILLTTQTTLAVLAAVLGAVTLAGAVDLWMVYVISTAIGVVAVFDNPTRQAFVTDMVGADQLANAVGLNSAAFNTARIAGPALAAAIIAVTGTGWCFVLNAVSFAAVIAGLLAMHPTDLYSAPPARRGKGQVREGLRYAASVPELRITLAMLALVGTFAMNFTVVLPLVAKFTFHGTASTLAWMLVTMGVGSLFGALMVAGRARPTGTFLLAASAALGVLMIGAALAPTLGWEYVLVALAGVAAIAYMSTTNALLQLASRPEMRGRVMAIYMVLFLGSTPIGSPIVGWIGQHASPRWSLAVGGAAALIAAGVGAVPLGRSRRLARATRPIVPVPADGDVTEVAVA